MLVSDQPRGTRLKAAAASARAAWLLFLEPGTVPDVTWIDETRRFMDDSEINDLTLRQAAVFRQGLGPSRSIAREALGLLRRALGARPSPEQGLLITKAFYDALGGHDAASAEPERDLYRRMGRRRIVLLPCSAAMVGR